MGKLKDKIIEVEELLLNGYDVEDIQYLTNISEETLQEILQYLKINQHANG